MNDKLLRNNYYNISFLKKQLTKENSWTLLADTKDEQKIETIRRATYNEFDFQMDNKGHHEKEKFMQRNSEILS